MRERRLCLLLGFLLVLVCVLHASTVHAELTNSGVLDRASNHFQQKLSQWAAILTPAASTLFWMLATCALVWQLGNAMMRGGGIDSALWELIRFVFITGLWWFVLQNAPEIGTAIVDSLRKLGELATNQKAKPMPSQIVDIGFSILWKTLKWVVLTLDEPIICAAGLLSAVLILIAFALIAVNMLILLVSQWFLLYGGIFFLGFGGAPWESQMAKNYLYTALSIGAQLFAMIGVVGVGQSFLVEQFDSLSLDTRIGELMVMLVIAILELALVNKVPALFARLIPGASSHSGVGFGGLLAAVGPAGVAMGVAAGMVSSGVANAIGAGKALGAASDAARASAGRAQTGAAGGAAGGAAATGTGSGGPAPQSTASVLDGVMGGGGSRGERGLGGSEVGRPVDTRAATNASDTNKDAPSKREPKTSTAPDSQSGSQVVSGTTNPARAAASSAQGPASQAATPNGASTEMEHAQPSSGDGSQKPEGEAALLAATSATDTEPETTAHASTEAREGGSEEDTTDANDEGERALRADTQATHQVDDELASDEDGQDDQVNAMGRDGSTSSSTDSDADRSLTSSQRSESGSGDGDAGPNRQSPSDVAPGAREGDSGSDLQPASSTSAAMTPVQRTSEAADASETGAASNGQDPVSATARPSADDGDYQTLVHAPSALRTQSPSSETEGGSDSSGFVQESATGTRTESADGSDSSAGRPTGDPSALPPSAAVPVGTPVSAIGARSGTGSQSVQEPSSPPQSSTTQDAPTTIGSATSPSADGAADSSSSSPPSAFRILGQHLWADQKSRFQARKNELMARADQTLGGRIATGIRKEYGLEPTPASAPPSPGEPSIPRSERSSHSGLTSADLEDLSGMVSGATDDYQDDGAKAPEDWATGDESITKAQRWYLQRRLGHDVDPDMTKAEASVLISRLKDES